MPVYKCVWFFDGVQANALGRTAPSFVGWTEVFYRVFDGVEQAVTICRDATNPNSWLTRRLAAMHGLYQCRWFRASQVDKPRVTKLVNVPEGSAGRLGVGAGGRLALLASTDTSAAQINCAVLCDLVAPPFGLGVIQHHRRILVRGLHNLMINGNVIREESASWQAMKRYFDLVAVGEAPVDRVGGPVSPWLMRVVQEGNPRRPVETIVINAAPGDRTIMLTAQLGAVNQGDRIVVSRVDGMANANRTWTVLDTAVGPVYRLGTAKRAVRGVFVPGSGTAYVQRFDYVAPTQYTPLGLRNKKVGPPSHPTRGRRRSEIH